MYFSRFIQLCFLLAGTFRSDFELQQVDRLLGRLRGGLNMAGRLIRPGGGLNLGGD